MKIYPKKISNLKKQYTFTSESVSHGHPDKICDQLADAILDRYLSKDPKARVAIEAFITANHVIIGGEVGSSYNMTSEKLEHITRQALKEIGYNEDMLNWRKIQITNLVHKQSPEIANSVISKQNKPEGAGDQGIMFGYACSETEVLMPASIHYSHQIMLQIINATKKGKLARLGPDAKCQLSLEYNTKSQLPFRAQSIVTSIQHDTKLSQGDVVELITPYIHKALPNGWIDESTKIIINPSGSFTIGGPQSDTGLTGRKLMVDTYGGSAPHGGGSFSGKDPSKVDRSGAYIARYVAKNIVAAGIANKCLIQLAYAIGIANPIAFYLDTFGTANVDESKILDIISKIIDFTPTGIKNRLQLNRPIYKITSTYGHFGRSPQENGSFSWEKLDLVDTLKTEIR